MMRISVQIPQGLLPGQAFGVTLDGQICRIMVPAVIPPRRVLTFDIARPSFAAAAAANHGALPPRDAGSSPALTTTGGQRAAALGGARAQHFTSLSPFTFTPSWGQARST